MFTHLQLKSGYSFLNSTITIDKLMKKAKSLEMGALALTDDGVLYGAVEFYQACKQEGIHPILGVTVPVIFELDEEERKTPLVLLAKNNNGYKGLIDISTTDQTTESLNIETIQKHAKDLICIIPSDTSFIKEQFIAEKQDLLVDLLKPLTDSFNETDLYIGIAYHSVEDESYIEACVNFCTYNEFQAVAMQDVRYLDEKDVISYDCLHAMKHGEKWYGYTNRPGIQQHHFAPQKEMASKFFKWPELISNISCIVERCQVSLDMDRQLLPAFSVPENESAETYLSTLCETALPKKYPNDDGEAEERMQYELTVIDQLGFSDYFLIVSDFVHFARVNGIATGPGRGSAAGSLVAYLLGITNVDPLKYELLFERFLNPERVTMPDIDIDFSDVRREEVIHYVREKYGTTHVAQIITFGTFLARSLLRELMKTMDIDYRDQAYILKHLPAQGNKGLLDIVHQTESFRDYIKQSESLRRLFAVALKLEGLPRHMSTHAAGIVIGKQPLMEDVPLTLGTHDTYLTQYAMNELEAIGLLKIDILGLRNLSLIERIIKNIERQEHRTIKPEQFPEKDPKTFKLLQNGQTNGIFQLESNGMKRVLRSLKPSSLEDIVAVNALYRPGPMEQIQTYIDRKHGKEKVTFLHPDLEPILASTYGVLIYQEQIIQVAHQFAGLSLGEADILRRAISKKDRKLIEKQKDNFMAGCRKKGYQETVAEEIFHWIYQFADYGFNKSHSVAYSQISYQLSYLKAHYPASFFAGFLGTVMNASDKLPAYVKEADDMGVELFPPSINQSYAYFTVENNNTVRMGFLAIKGIGYETAQEIIEKRKQGYFADVFDFCLRVHIKRNNLETLILAGVFDETYNNRASLLASLDQAYARAELFGDIHSKGSLFTDEMKMTPAYTNTEDFSVMQRLSDEKELMQLYVTHHPIQAYRSKLSLLHYTTLDQAKVSGNHKRVQLIVIAEKIKKIHTKRGESMAFMTISDETDEMEVVIFPALYREVHPQLTSEQIIYLEGKVSIRGGQHQIIADQLMSVNIEEIVQQMQSFFYIKVTKNKREEKVLPFLRNIADKYPGKTGIILYNEAEQKTFKLGDNFNTDNGEEAMQALKGFFGNQNVVFTNK